MGKIRMVHDSLGIDTLSGWFGTSILFSHILGMSSSQLTFIFFRGVAQPPTSYVRLGLFT